ncbi:hypothetical protein VTN96DRAFT_6442 [Rasamsonia emersonii]|uniref:BZIP domain-containing protein n=1 Tax=Rasamsonia emersonii (strain ATCC 16479 / CBS 393.64 / IMI 116815) TaxID=1408163 RepID=A0A0F4Z0C9_RASE3|nr:hypothetical protein T310_2422 [Rasamsonia emersonii CBS 393.64]KKA23546.1 hypothetical protein T310_2422 [Rasamsonia emersonii CBS 393.64]
MDFSYFNAPQHQPFQPFGLHNPHAGVPHSEDFQTGAQSVSFDYHYGSFDPSSFPNVGVAPPYSPPESFTLNSTNSTTSADVARDDLPKPVSTENADDHIADRKSGSGRSSSEEKDTLTPAQSRRKAQNRAAQRAFRERKERHVRELEQKLSDLQQTSNDLYADNERLKRELAKVSTENEILRATTQSGVAVKGHGESDPGQTTTGPMRFSPTDFYSSVTGEKGEHKVAHRIVVSEETGERLLDAGATWDMIQNHKLFKQGLVDIGDVCERLKGFVRCDGQGPVFEESRVRKAIEESVAGGSDELI